MVQTHVSKGDFGGVNDISAVPPEHRVGLVLHNKNNVRRDVGGRLIALLGKGDLRPLLPSLLYLHLQDLVLGSPAPPVRVQPLVGDLHLLDAPGEHLFQGNLEVMHDRGVLTFGQTSAPSHAPHAPPPPAKGAREPSQPAAGHPKAGERVLWVHFLTEAPVAAAE